MVTRTRHFMNSIHRMSTRRSSSAGNPIVPSTAISMTLQPVPDDVTSYKADAVMSAAAPVTPSPKKPQKRKRIQSKVETAAAATATTAAATATTATATTATAVAQITSSVISLVNPDQPFIDLQVPPEELRPSATLTTGQCFHWKAVAQDLQQREAATKTSAWGTHDATEWIGTLRTSQGDSIVMVIRETPTTTMYRPLTRIPSDFHLDTYLREYFQLETSLAELYRAWSDADKRLSRIAKCIPGVRIVDQNPWECLISFICSSNNNIPRITKMLAAIRKEFGSELITIAGETFYSFPSLEAMQEKATDEILRTNCGMGYRSKYILETMNILANLGGEPYLHELRGISDPTEVQEKLCQFCGVGRKVADCVALFSLQQDGAIPVDVHVWNIARRDYDEDNALEDIKSMTPKVYNQVGKIFRDQFDEKPGWAHSLLFVAELPSFREVLPADLVKEMEDFRKEEQLKKQKAKKDKEKAKKLKVN